MYDPVRYWQRRGAHYRGKRTPGELEQLAGALRQLQPVDVLEVGSGAGRLLSYLREHVVLQDIGAEYSMCDFVDSMIDSCEHRTGVRPDKWDGERLPYSDRAFDLVISFSVLLHVPPSALARLWAEHVRVSNRWIYVASMASSAVMPALHCFVHDYVRLFEGVRVVDVVTFDSRRHWLIDVRGDKGKRNA